MAESNVWNWKRFLYSLSLEKAEPFIKEEQLLSELHVLLEKRGYDSSEILWDMVSSVHIGNAPAKSRPKRNQQQDDSSLKASASKWTVDDLTKHIMREHVDLVLVLCQSESPDRICVPDFMNCLINCSKQIMVKSRQFSDDWEDGLKLWTLPFWKINEATISMLVQRMLGPVCQSLEVIMKPEQYLPKDDQFGTAEVDFALFYEGFCIGVVEVKTPNSLKPDSVAQLLLPLMKLRLKDRDSRADCLGILTDGYHYVFAKLQGDKFIFENLDDVDPIIIIHKAMDWEVLDRLLKYIRSILEDILTPLKTSSARVAGTSTSYFGYHSDSEPDSPCTP